MSAFTVTCDNCGDAVRKSEAAVDGCLSVHGKELAYYCSECD